MSLSPYILQIKFFMFLFFYLFTLAINLWKIRKFGTATSLQCLSINMVYSATSRGQDFDKKKFIFEGVHSKRLTDEFPEKSWTKRGVN